MSHNLTGVDNIVENPASEDYSKTGGGYKSVDTDTLFQIGYTQSATVFTGPTGTYGSGQFSWGGSSSLAELSTALRPPSITYHKLGTLGAKEANVGESYSDWVMDTVVNGEMLQAFFTLSNGQSGPWSENGRTFTYTSDDAYAGNPLRESLSSKDCMYNFTKEQWVALESAPQEHDVTVEVKDNTLADSPTRTAKIKIKLHNPYENWRLSRDNDGNPLESYQWRSPEFFEYTPSTKVTTFLGDEAGLTFKYRHSYPVVQHVQDSITGNPLLRALQDFVPIKWVPIAIKAGISAASVLSAEAWQGPYQATFGGKWDDANSTFDPPKDESKKDQYVMTVGVDLKYKVNAWLADGYDSSGYTGLVYGSTDQRTAGQKIYGVFKIGATGGGIGGGGITPL